ncbi:unnamed protein product [Effrenium voratum]|nr:unnamed protein product [Effrenium voratum]
MAGLMATQMASGFFAAAAIPTTQSLVSERVQESSRGGAFSILAMCAGFSNSAAAMLGAWSWQTAYRVMGSTSLMFALLIFIFFPADPRDRPDRKSLSGEISAELQEMRRIFCIPTFLALLLGGVVGCIPWSALSFLMMYFQNLGFSPSHAAALLTIMSVGRIFGSLLGGLLGDSLARRLPLHGRALVGQSSILLGMAPLYWVLCCYPHSNRSSAALSLSLFVFSLTAMWCNPGVDRPLWAELVPADCRGKIIGWWKAVAESCGTIFGGPLVGYISVALLGYQPSKSHNAESLGWAMAVCTMLPWAVCFCCYSAIHFTYPRDCPRKETARLLPPELKMHRPH